MFAELIDRIRKSIFGPQRRHRHWRPAVSNVAAPAHHEPAHAALDVKPPCSACANLAASQWIERQIYTERSIRN